MASTSNLILWLFWNTLFCYLKGSELISYDTNINLTDYKSAGTDYESHGDNDSIFDNDIQIYDQDIWNTDDEFDYNSKINEASLQSDLVNSVTVTPIVFGSNQSWAEREKLINSKLRDLFKSQHPEVGYNLRNYYAENWPEDVDLMKDHWSTEELDKINERLPILQFRLRDKCFTICKQFGFDKMKCLTEAELNSLLTYSMVNKFLHQRYKVESENPYATRLNWKLLDRRSVPDKYNEVPLNFLTIQSPFVYQNREIIDNIHFYSAVKKIPKSKQSNRPNRTTKPTRPVIEQSEEILDSLREFCTKESENINFDCYRYRDRGHVRDRSKKLKSELKELFCKQNPHKRYNLRDYQIENWPSEVDLYKNSWTNQEMNIIKSKMSEFEFVPMPKTIEFGVVLEKDWTRAKVFQLILDRFRHESGNPDANFVNWDLIDRSLIHSKYNRFEINHFTMNEPRFYKNPEIVPNIHFKRSLKRKADEIEQEIALEEDIDVDIDVDGLYHAIFGDKEDVKYAEV